MQKKGRKIVVIGGNAAGLSAASKAKRVNPSTEVYVLEKGKFASYSSCGIPYVISGVVPDFETLIALDKETIQNKRGINLHTECEVVDIHPQKRYVIAVNRTTGDEVKFEFDKLVLCTGGQPKTLPIDGVDNDGVFMIRNLEDGYAIDEYLTQYRPRKAVVIGGGYIGLEMAEALSVRKLEVVLIEKNDRLLKSIDGNISGIITEKLQNNKVDVIYNTTVSAIESSDGQKLRIVTNNYQNFSADIVIIGIGIKPSMELAKRAGIRLGRSGAIAVDKKMMTNHPNIFAAGDCAEAMHLITNKPAYVPLGTTANKQGKVAGENAAGGFAIFNGIVGTAIVKVFEFAFAKTGLTEPEAKHAGFNVVTSQSVAGSKVHYYPGVVSITTHLVIDKTSRRLLGAQMVGEQGVGKRIDVFTTVITNKMTIDEIARLDLSYAPPYAPVWDPILISANAAIRLLGKKY